MKYAAAAAIATLTIAACGTAVAEEPQSQPAPQPEAVTPVEPVEKESAPDLGFDRDVMVDTLDVCMDANDNMIDATETAMVTLDVDWLYVVIADENDTCLDAMVVADATITDPELSGLWADAMDATVDLIVWTDAGWPGTEIDLIETLDRQAAVTEAWGDLAEWSDGIGGFDI